MGLKLKLSGMARNPRAHVDRNSRLARGAGSATGCEWSTAPKRIPQCAVVTLGRGPQTRRGDSNKKDTVAPAQEHLASFPPAPLEHLAKTNALIVGLPKPVGGQNCEDDRIGAAPKLHPLLQSASDIAASRASKDLHGNRLDAARLSFPASELNSVVSFIPHNHPESAQVASEWRTRATM